MIGIYKVFRPILLTIACGLSVFTLSSSSLHADPVVKKHPASINTTKGQGQVSGANGEFGTVYSYQIGWNMEILKAKYSIEPIVTYENSGFTSPIDGEKMLVVSIAIKNATTDDDWVGSIPTISAIDQNQHQYDSTSTELMSQGSAGFGGNLKPGQGEGQPELNDPLVVIFRLPIDSRITKLIVNNGRLHTSETVLRYYIAGTTAAEAGEDGDPANVISPLPTDVHDPSDTTGAIALANGIGGKPGSGQVCPTGALSVSVASVSDAPAGDMFNGNAPDDGKKFVYTTVTAKNVIKNELTSWSLSGSATNTLIDTDDDSYDLVGLAKATSTDPVSDDHKIEPGASYTFRLVFQVPTSAKLKTLHYGSDGGRYWNFDLSGN